MEGSVTILVQLVAVHLSFQQEAQSIVVPATSSPVDRGVAEAGSIANIKRNIHEQAERDARWRAHVHDANTYPSVTMTLSPACRRSST